MAADQTGTSWFGRATCCTCRPCPAVQLLAPGVSIKSSAAAAALVRMSATPGMPEHVACLGSACDFELVTADTEIDGPVIVVIAGFPGHLEQAIRGTRDGLLILFTAVKVSDGQGELMIAGLRHECHAEAFALAAHEVDLVRVEVRSGTIIEYGERAVQVGSDWDD